MKGGNGHIPRKLYSEVDGTQKETVPEAEKQGCPKSRELGLSTQKVKHSRESGR